MSPVPPFRHFLQPGEYMFSRRSLRIGTLLGSCIAFTCWHPQLRIGGMCHYLLPARSGSRFGGGLDGRYADEALALLLHKMRQAKTDPAEYEIKMFGGGNMFPNQPGRSMLNVGERNIRAGRILLLQHGLPCKAFDVGGAGHRRVELDLASGDVWVRRVGMEDGDAQTLPCQQCKAGELCHLACC